MLRNIVVSSVFLASIIGFNLPVAHASNRSHDPAGNNGVIKISDEASHDGRPNNNPHVSCKFFVEFYNYDQGDYNAEVEFKLHAPTNRGQTLEVTSGNLNPFIGEDKAGGGTDLDAREEYQLAFTGDPHPKQGYHVKVKVRAPESKGSDKKQKVFWVLPCEEGEVLSAKDEPKNADNNASVTDDRYKGGKGGAPDFEPKTLSTSTESVADDVPAKGGALPETGASTIATSALIALSAGLLSYALHYKFSDKENAFQL